MVQSVILGIPGEKKKKKKKRRKKQTLTYGKVQRNSGNISTSDINAADVATISLCVVFYVKEFAF